MKTVYKFSPIVFLCFVLVLNSCTEAKNVAFITPENTITVEPSQTNTPIFKPTVLASPTLNNPTSVIPLVKKTAKLPSPYENVKVAYNDQSWLWVWKNGSSKAITPIGLYSMLSFSPDGSNQRTVLTFEPYKFEYYPYFPQPFWSEDSQSLIIETQSINPALTPVISDYPPNEPLVNVWLIPVIGTPQKILQTTKYHDLYYSSDLSKFLYVKQVAEDKPTELHMANKDGSKDQILYTSTKVNENYRDISFYDWSPDSKSIIFDELDDELTWMELQNNSMKNIRLLQEEPPYLTSMVWLDSSHFVVYRHAMDGIWLAVPGEEYIQIAQLNDSDLNPYDFANGFDVFLDK